MPDPASDIPISLWNKIIYKPIWSLFPIICFRIFKDSNDFLQIIGVWLVYHDWEMGQTDGTHGKRRDKLLAGVRS